MRSTCFRLLLGLLVLVGSVMLVSAPSNTLTVHDKAYYLTPEANELIRPGYVIKIASADIAADGTVKARVKLTDAKGGALDRNAIQTPGTIACSMILAYIPNGQTQYVSYASRNVVSNINGKSAVQATGDSGGTWTTNAIGDYTYTFGTKLPANYQKNATHTIGAYGSRNLTEFGLGTQYADATYNWVPDGTSVKTVRDVVRTATCNKCHTSMGFHGGSRRSMEICVLCHTPQTTDPDTGNTLDMVVMGHKIHSGATLPSVKAGKPYQIIGHGDSVSDYSKINFPADVRSCEVCHEAPATQAANEFNPSRVACGSCHDDVNFATGANHINLPQVSDSNCKNCHIRQGELDFDASIMGAHTIPTQSRMLPGVVFDILSVADAAPGKKPTVVFSIKDKKGNPIPASQMTSISLYMYQANPDITSYVRESNVALADSASDGRSWWTMNTAIPANAKGSITFAIEGRRDITLLPGTVKQQTVRDFGLNKRMTVSLDGSPVQPRRVIVTSAKCQACHKVLSFHGGNRNQVEQCVICHNPTGLSGKLSIDLPVMIHKIHMGDELTVPYTIGSMKTQEMGYPGIRSACGMCHVNGSEQLPLADGLSNVNFPGNVLNPMGATTAACTACHDSVEAASHALSQTNALGESCAACHGPNADFSVSKVHAQ